MSSSTSTPFDGLHASPPQALPFAPDLHIRTFLLERAHGNVAVYSSETAAALGEAGKVSWQYLNHWHEAMFHPADPFGAPLLAHADDAAEVDKRAGVEPVTFSGRHGLGEGFEIIPIPGHTPGATAYLWEHGGHRFLFTGDTVYLQDGKWIAGLLESSDRTAMRASLELIRELDFDVLVPWAASAGQDFYALTDPADTRRRVDHLLVATGLEDGAPGVVGGAA